MRSGDGAVGVIKHANQHSLAEMVPQETEGRGYCERRPGGESTAMAATEAEEFYLRQSAQLSVWYSVLLNYAG